MVSPILQKRVDLSSGLPPAIQRGFVGRRAAYAADRTTRAEAMALAIDLDEFDGLIARGVPFHTAADGRQQERLTALAGRRKLQSGATLFLVQPHEYMPRIRRWIHRTGRAFGFSARIAHSYLFRVDAPGRKAMPLHDDGDVESVWLQLTGKRYAAFGPVGDTAITPGCLAPGKADGRKSGWFQGPLKTGSLLYLPPLTPHWVQCRKPSVALSVYWEPEDLPALAADWLRHLHGQPDWKPSPKTTAAMPLARHLRRAADMAKGQRYAEWLALRATADGGRDAPPTPAQTWAACKRISAWRAIDVLPGLGDVTIAAGGEAILSFPSDARGLLNALAHYGTCSTGQARRLMPDRDRRERLLDILIDEGLIAQEELPSIGEFDRRDLTGSSYSIKT